MTERYWQTRAGLSIRHYACKSRIALVQVDQEPQGKGKRGRTLAPSFIGEVRDQLSRQSPARGIHWPRADLAADLTFRTTALQPPLVERLAKHYLDLLEDVLYTNDRQIKMLSVSTLAVAANRVRGADSAGSVVVWCQTRTHALAAIRDAAALHELAESSSIELQDSIDGQGKDIWDLYEQLAPVQSTDQFSELAETLRPYRQQALLEANDHAVRTVFRLYGDALVTGVDPIERRAQSFTQNQLATGRDQAMADRLADRVRPGTAQRWANTALRYLISIPLPALPSGAGLGEAFARSADLAIAAFALAHPELAPILTPLRVTMLVVPTRHGIDLDNLALRILPSVRRHLLPSERTATPWTVPDLITGFQAIKLARRPRRSRGRVTDHRSRRRLGRQRLDARTSLVRSLHRPPDLTTRPSERPE